jgi:hypothetical protein
MNAPLRENLFNGQPRAVDAFAVINTFVDLGWLAVLNPLQLVVWMAYYRHANFAADGGEVYDKISTAIIAQKVGHKNGQHVRTARAALVKLGLLEIIEAGNPKTMHTARVRVLPPPPPPSQFGTRGASPRAGLVRERDAAGTGTSPDLGLAPVPDPAAPPAEIGTEEHKKNTKVKRKGAEAPAGEPVKAPLRVLTDHWCTAYLAKYGEKYVAAGKSDWILLNTLLTRSEGDVDKAKRVLDRYLASTEQFYYGHPIAKLMSATALPVFMLDNARRPVQRGTTHEHRESKRAAEFTEERSALATY